MAARAITEARGGRVLSDVFQMLLKSLQVIDQNWRSIGSRLSRALSGQSQGQYWLAADMVIITAAWNTNW